MKELYTSPELKVTCFAPVERIANAVIGNEINFGDLWDAAGGKKDPANKSVGDDFTVKLP